MNERTFLKQIASDERTRTRIEAEIEAIFSDYARTEEIPLNELSDTQIRQLANGFVERGFNE